MTSRTAVGLRNMLSEEADQSKLKLFVAFNGLSQLPGVDLPFTLIFDYPSVASISVPWRLAHV